jgi:hypothetical protein
MGDIIPVGAGDRKASIVIVKVKMIFFMILKINRHSNSEPISP